MAQSNDSVVKWNRCYDEEKGEKKVEKKQFKRNNSFRKVEFTGRIRKKNLEMKRFELFLKAVKYKEKSRLVSCNLQQGTGKMIQQ